MSTLVEVIGGAFVNLGAGGFFFTMFFYSEAFNF